jgi:hypothetical protein
MPLAGYGEPLRGWPSDPAPTAKPRLRGFGRHGRLNLHGFAESANSAENEIERNFAQRWRDRRQQIIAARVRYFDGRASMKGIFSDATYPCLVILFGARL